MKYMGGKSKIAKEIVPIIQRHIEARGTGKYIEPFVGGANIIDKVECESRVGLDINRYLIALFNHIQSGGEKPEGIAVEMADCIIRILDWIGREGIDIDAIIRMKHEYNTTRPYKHGGKVC